MSTSKTTPTTEQPSLARMVHNYTDKLLDRHERVTKTMHAARGSGAQIVEEVADWVATGQRETLELGRRLASHPAAYVKNLEAVLDAVTAAQERTLDLTKRLYREQAHATAALRECAEPMFETSRTLADTVTRLTGLRTGSRA